MPAKGLFITGTDTGCGKTEITLALMRRLQDTGYRVLGLKPVASGAEETGDGLRNADALRIQAAGSMAVPYELINPYAFEPPVAPHVAADEAGVCIEARVIRDACAAMAELADVVLVEGVGGWRVPLAPALEVADLPRLLNMPVLLVVGLRLGCLNHALLSAESIAGRANLGGWVANQVEPDMLRSDENVDTLRRTIDAPLVARCGFLPEAADAERMAAAFDAQRLSALLGF